MTWIVGRGAALSTAMVPGGLPGGGRRRFCRFRKIRNRRFLVMPFLLVRF